MHLVCRPREHFDGSLRTSEIGDWRQVLSDLPRRIHEWMPRLAEEGTVGADAIFACLESSRVSRAQRALFDELEEVAEQQGWGEVGTPRAGSTTSDRVHQAMTLFGAGRGEALKRFLVDEGVGRASQF